MTTTQQEAKSFESLGLSPVLCDALKTIEFTQPTPIQEQVLPIALQSKDIIGIAQTGTGKTLAFGLPMMHYLMQNYGKGLVMVPTRELALQVEETLQKVAGNLGLKTVVLIGGTSMYAQISKIRREHHIIIATPGRLMDHVRQKTIRLDDVQIVTLDEADRMLDIGFGPQIKKILELIPAERQTLLFSATMPTEIHAIAKNYMRDAIKIQVASAGTTAEKIQQEIYITAKDQKGTLLQKILTEHAGTVLVFSRTKFGARKICYNLKTIGHTSAEIHSDRSLSQRREALDGFKSGKYRVLVATDIAARGIDVKGIGLVVNYDLPDNVQDYVHRIGRTGRAGQEGKAISFATPDQRRDIRDIERLIKKPLRTRTA
jgi:ATP-dependent RNA helicase RhlE